MTMLKHSQRTVKCKRCGSRDFYWFHDTNSKGRRECDEHPGQTSWVLVRAETEYLKHQRLGRGCEDVQHVPAQPEPEPTPEPVETASKPEPEPVEATPTPEPAKPETGDDTPPSGEMAELRRILSSIIGTSVDEETVGRIVDDRLADFKTPTRVTVHNADTGEDRELPDVSHKVLPKVLKALPVDNVWLVGPAGTGKSTIASQAADLLGVKFGAISLSPNTPVSEIVGYRDANGNYNGTVFRDIYENGGVFLVDEADNGHPSTLAKVNMALSNGHMAFPDGMIKRNPEFRCIVAANTYGDGPDRQYVGRMKLDAATLDRFSTVYVGVDEALEDSVAYAQGAERADVDRLLTLVRRLRQSADDKGMQLMFSPRASIFGARLLAQGFTHDEVVEMRVRKGISEQDWNKVNG